MSDQAQPEAAAKKPHGLLRRGLQRLVLALGWLTLLWLVFVGVGIAVKLGMKPSVPAQVLLEIELGDELFETRPTDPIGRILTRNVPSLRDLVDALDRGRGDERVAGLVLTVGGTRMGLAQVQELRDAVQRFRDSGKPALAFADTFGELEPANGAYYLAAAADEVWMQPSGTVGLMGFVARTPFIRDALDSLGVVPVVERRHEYKAAANTFTETGYTSAHKEELAKVLASFLDQVVSGVAADRKVDAGLLRRMVDKAPVSAKDALAVNLVDRLGYRDEAYAHIREQAGKGAKLLFAHEYLDRAGRPHEEGAKIAIIHGIGGVERGESVSYAFDGDSTMGSKSVTAALRAARKDKEVKAIVFRIDSPGGSYVASDSIWREVMQAKEAGKPVVATMGNVAGSGGYFVAMAADKIVAQPGTLTGSIGVLGGKLVTRAFWQRFGVNWDEVHEGESAGMFLWTEDFSDAQHERFREWLDRVYDDFTAKVAAGRMLPLERVREIAKGRIWSGKDAKELGLVDELGGVHEALALARELAGLPKDAKLKLVPFPPPEDPWEELIEGGPDSSEREAAEAALRAAVRVARGAAGVARAVGIELDSAPGERVLTMPPVQTSH